MMPRQLDSTYLSVDPLTGRRVSEACFNGKHVQGIYSTCNAVACKCLCHDAKEKRTRAKREEQPAPPITAEKLGAA